MTTTFGFCVRALDPAMRGAEILHKTFALRASALEWARELHARGCVNVRCYEMREYGAAGGQCQIPIAWEMSK